MFRNFVVAIVVPVCCTLNLLSAIVVVPIPTAPPVYVFCKKYPAQLVVPPEAEPYIP